VTFPEYEFLYYNYKLHFNGCRLMSGHVGSVISESGMVENVGVAAGTASLARSVQESFPLPGYSPQF